MDTKSMIEDVRERIGDRPYYIDCTEFAQHVRNGLSENEAWIKSMHVKEHDVTAAKWELVRGGAS